MYDSGEAMSSPRIEAFLIDDENEEKFAAHGLSARHVTEILENIHVVLRNRRGRRGLYLVVGRDNGGACVAVPVARTHEPSLWRPITAWPCKPRERTLLERRGRAYERET